MKNSLAVVLCIVGLAMVGCVRKETPEEQAQRDTCTDSGLEQAVYNNIKYRNEIREDFKECLKGNSNRDVVYNDTNELANSCKVIAHEMHGGIAASNWTYPADSLARIEAKLRKCGKLKEFDNK